MTHLVCCILEPDPVLTGWFVAVATTAGLSHSLVGKLPVSPTTQMTLIESQHEQLDAVRYWKDINVKCFPYQVLTIHIRGEIKIK